MKAILYRKNLNKNINRSNPNSGWLIRVISEDADQTQVRYLLEESVKAGNETQLIDYDIHNDNTYTIDSMLSEVSLGVVESFYSKPSEKNDYGDEAGYADSEGYAPSGNRLFSREEYEYVACPCGNPNCVLNHEDSEGVKPDAVKSGKVRPRTQSTVSSIITTHMKSIYGEDFKW